MSSSQERSLLRPGRVVLGLVVLLLGLLVISGCTSSGVSSNIEMPAPEVGHPAPDFTLADLEGNLLRLSDLQGKVVFINFWATWCPPCRREMPQIEAVYQEYKDKGVEVIGVDIMEPEDTVRQFVQEGGYSWRFVLDTTGAVSANYEIRGIPTSFFINREGIIRAVQVGEMTKGAMEAKLALAMP